MSIQYLWPKKTHDFIMCYISEDSFKRGGGSQILLSSILKTELPSGPSNQYLTWLPRASRCVVLDSKTTSTDADVDFTLTSAIDSWWFSEQVLAFLGLYWLTFESAAFTHSQGLLGHRCLPRYLLLFLFRGGQEGGRGIHNPSSFSCSLVGTSLNSRVLSSRIRCPTSIVSLWSERPPPTQFPFWARNTDCHRGSCKLELCVFVWVHRYEWGYTGS